jgi:hypothetical protein
MTWFKVDDSFHSHPKALAAGPAAVGLWTIAGTWSCANLTDGFVPDYVLPRLAEGAQELARTLVAAGLWRRAKGGHRFHDWDVYQRSREEVLEERKKWAEKKATQREAKRAKGHRSSSDDVMSPGDTPGDAPGESSSSHSRSRTSPNGEVKDTPPASPGPPRGSRGSRLPDDFTVTAEMAAWAREKAPSCGPVDHEAFCDYWRSTPGAKGRKVDWPATWRNWMRREHERRTPAARSSPGGSVVHLDRRQQATNDLFDRARERARARDAQEARGEP